MSLPPHITVLVLACAACAGHGRRSLSASDVHGSDGPGVLAATFPSLVELGWSRRTGGVNRVRPWKAVGQKPLVSNPVARLRGETETPSDGAVTVTTTAPAEGSDFKWPWTRNETKDPANKKANPLEQIKKYGVAGAISYALLAGGFYAFFGLAGLYAYYVAFGHLPDLSNTEDVAKVGAEIVGLVNLAAFAVPVKLALAASTAPWVDRNIVQRLGLNKKQDVRIDWDHFAEGFKIVDETGAAVEGLNNIVLLKMLSDTPLNTGSGIELEKLYAKRDNGEAVVVAKWNFKVQESDLSNEKVIDDLKKVYDFPLKVAGSSTFNLNRDRKVEKIKIGSWSINEQVVPEEVSLENLVELSNSGQADDGQ